MNRLGSAVKQGGCLISLALSLCYDEQLDAAEEAASRTIDLLREQGQQSQACKFHRVLGEICRSHQEKGARGGDREDYSPSRGSSRNGVLIQLAQRAVLGSSFSGVTVFR